MNFDIFNHTILLTRAGSRAYGIHTPASDLDLKGVAIPPRTYTLGLDRFEQADSAEHFKDPRYLALLPGVEAEVVKNSKLEGTVYDLRKFLGLALDANPNILDVLFCRDEDVLSWGNKNVSGTNRLGAILREHRDIFLSTKAKHTFSGYAIAQLKRINTHRRWLIKPPDHKPNRAEFNLPESTLIPADQLAAAEAMVRKKIDAWEIDLSKVEADADRIYIMGQIHNTMTEVIAGVRSDIDTEAAKWRAAVHAVGIDDNLLLIMEQERKYKSAKTEWTNYQNWLNTRNPVRAALEAKHGYDTKHGAHLVRLMRMCEEILTTGKVNVWRGGIDADEIQSIRNGAWTYDQVVEFGEAADKRCTELYKQSKLPKHPNREVANDLCIKLLQASV